MLKMVITCQQDYEHLVHVEPNTSYLTTVATRYFKIISEDTSRD